MIDPEIPTTYGRFGEEEHWHPEHAPEGAAAEKPMRLSEIALDRRWCQGCTKPIEAPKLGDA